MREFLLEALETFVVVFFSLYNESCNFRMSTAYIRRRLRIAIQACVNSYYDKVQIVFNVNNGRHSIAAVHFIM